MYGLGFPAWHWDWGWLAGIGTIILLSIFLVPWFFFLLNLHTTLSRVSPRNRAMPPAHVWLNFIPVFNLGWIIYTVLKVTESLRAEYGSRGWIPENDFGYNVGLATGVLAIASFVLGWAPVLGWGLGIAELVCWILYWVRTAEAKNRLGEPGMWSGHPGAWGADQPAGGPAAGPGGGAGPGQWGGPSGPYPGAQSYPGAQPHSQGPAAGAAGPSEAATTGAAPSAGAAAPGGPAACAYCGTAFDPGDRFCRTCGMALPPRT